MQKKSANDINIIIGDINARRLCLGDKKDAIEGQHMMKNLHRKNWIILNREFAYGTPTYETNNGGSSVVDIAVIPGSQLQL